MQPTENSRFTSLEALIVRFKGFTTSPHNNTVEFLEPVSGTIHLNGDHPTNNEQGLSFRGVFKNCVFILSGKVKLTIHGTIEECRVKSQAFPWTDVSVKEFLNYPRVYFKCDSIKRLNLEGGFREIVFDPRSVIEYLTAVELSASSLRLSQCNITYGHLAGHFSDIYGDECGFHCMKWEPNFVTGDLVRANFRGSTVIIGEWIERLEKHGVDFQSARTLVDPWMRLREEFTGISSVKNVLLTIAFFSPIIVKAVFYVVMGDLVKTQALPTVKFAELLFFGGYSGWVAFVHCIATSILILFNLLRLWVTLNVGRLGTREDYLRSIKFELARPKLSLVDGYSDWAERSLFTCAKVVRILFWVSFVYACVQCIRLLAAEIPLITAVDFRQMLN